jgi:hypothetical protein
VQAIRIGQFVHLVLILAVVVVYAVLKALLPPDDPDRTHIDLVISIVAALWGAAVFIELLIGKKDGSLKERALSAYRRLLNRPLTLLLGDILLGLVCAGGICLLVLYRSVEIYSVSEVEVFLNDPGAPSRRIGSIKEMSTGKLRLRVGERMLVFKVVVSRDQTVAEEVGYAKAIRVDLPWRDMDRIHIPEIMHYVPLR